MCVREAILMSTTSCYAATNQSTSMSDSQKSKGGSGFRKKIRNLGKARTIEKHENTYGDLTMAEWACKMSTGRKYDKNVGKSKAG